MSWYSVTQSKSQRTEPRESDWSYGDIKYHEVKTWACPRVKPQQQGQYFRTSEHRVRGVIGRCLTSEWSIQNQERGREMSVLVFGTWEKEGMWREMVGNKGWGLKVHSFWTIPGTRIPVPRDLPVRQLWFWLFKGLRVLCLKQRHWPPPLQLFRLI